MSAKKIEPASIQRIKELVAYYDGYTLRSVILWGANAEARARMAEHAWFAESQNATHGKYGKSRDNKCDKCNQPFKDWLAAVKREIGWPE